MERIKKYFCAVAACLVATMTSNGADADDTFGPVPSQRQLDWQQMETYAFIHYSINTYTDQEWGYGNEDPALFNPSNLDVVQWVDVCKAAGMKGIILTAKHHSGFCLWPSSYTEYSVKNSPWKEGRGDIVRELADECRRQGLKFAVYLSPWDRNHALYGQPEYVEYFRNQLQELLTGYGDIFEVWFDGANGGTGWYGGADERRSIDRATYYDWPVTYAMVRQLQPDCVIWADKANRADLRWVGNEAGYVGQPNWSLLPAEGELTKEQLHHGVEDGDLWIPGEVNTSIRPGWFYHEKQDDKVKSLATLVEAYYKSVGRNGTLLLNFPVRPDGLIDRRDSIAGAQFGRYLEEFYKKDLASEARIETTPDTLTVWFDSPTTFNRVMLQEDIAKGQRVRSFNLEAKVDGHWTELRDELLPEDESLTTIGYKRIICFPEVEAEAVRCVVTDAKAVPHLSRIAVFNAPPVD